MTKYTLFCSLASTAICVSPSFAQQNGYPADVQLRIGMCDGSAAVALGNDRFVVADDEDNVLRVYPRGQGQAPLQAFDMNAFLQPETAKPETDTEGATLVGNRIYWITSHGRNKNGAVRGSRYRFWATQWEARGERVALNFVGFAYTQLLQDLVAEPSLAKYGLDAASQLAPKSQGALNIEGLAAMPDGTLLIGFRNPIPAGKALVVPLLNPTEVIARTAPPRFGAPLEFDLGGLGVRGFEYVPARRQFAIIAGDIDAGRPSQLFTWSGAASEPARLVAGVNFGDLNPESVIVYADEAATLQVVSDDGTKMVDGRPCKEGADVRRRSFRTAWVSF
jgi:hypothetical protein